MGKRMIVFKYCSMKMLKQFFFGFKLIFMYAKMNMDGVNLFHVSNKLFSCRKMCLKIKDISLKEIYL